MRVFQLPAQAQAKLSELQMQMMSAEDGGRALTSRLGMLPNEGADDLRGKMTAELARLQRRHGQLHQLVNRVQQWFTELPHTTILQQVPPADVDLKGATLDAAINDTRSRIKATRDHLQAVRTAPLPLADQKQLAQDYVVGLIRAGKPTVAFVNDVMKVIPRGDVFCVDDQLALIAWSSPDALLRALERAIDALPTREDAMPRSERIKRVAEIETQLLQLEQREESLIVRAAGDGLEILRRVDADPKAILGVVITQARAAVA